METYSYKPLGCPNPIRILSLEPANAINEPLFGSLRQVSLDDSPSYEALSYVWGSAEPSDFIQIRSSSGSRTSLRLTPNCGQALRHLRLRHSARVLWIDALCINQDDLAERNQQVANMMEVYAGANRVLVWLDSLDLRNMSRRRFRNLKMLGKIVAFAKMVPQTSWNKDTLWATCARWPRKMWVTTAKDYTKSLVNNNYWSRAWTVQEMAVADVNKTMIITCQGSLKWYNIIPLLMVAYYYGFESPSGYEFPRVNAIFGFRLAAAARYHTQIGRQTPSTDTSQPQVWGTKLMTTFTILEAKEPRDQAYAMKWIFHDLCGDMDAHPHFRSFSQVDYTKPVDTVYSEFAAVLITESSLLAAIVVATQETRSCTLPSWVIDLAAPPRRESDQGFIMVVCDGEASGASKALSPVVETESWSLKIKGQSKVAWNVKDSIRLLDPVETKPPDLSLVDEDRWHTLMSRESLEFLDNLLQSIPSYSTGPNDILYLPDGLFLDSLADTLRFHIEHVRTSSGLDPTRDLDQWLNGIRPVILPYGGRDIDSVAESMGPKLRTSLLEGNPLPKDWIFFEFARYDKMMQTAIVVLYANLIGREKWLGKYLFITESGLVGVGNGIEQGDRVVLWSGVPCPTVIRDMKSKQGHNACEIVSAAYVPKLMKGEGWDMEAELETFTVY